MKRWMCALLAVSVTAVLMNVPAHAEPDMPEAPGAMEAMWAVPASDILDPPMLPLTVEAAVINVNTTNDELNTDGDCSLREAIDRDPRRYA